MTTFKKLCLRIKFLLNL